MADYYPLLARAVSGLTDAPQEQRQAIYARARKALLGQLRGVTPPVPEADIERESQALDEAIARLEREIADAVVRAEPVAPPPSPVPPPRPSFTPPPLPTPPARPPLVPPPPFLRPAPSPPPAFQPPAGRPPLPGAGRSSTAPDMSASRPGADIPASSPASASFPSAGARDDFAPDADAPPGPVSQFRDDEPPAGDAPRVAIKVRAPDPATRPELGSRDNGRDSIGKNGGKSEPAVHPAAPRPEESSGGFRRVALIVGAIVILCAGAGFTAWKMRDNPEDITKGRAPIVDPAPVVQNSGPKINERAGPPGAAPARPSELQPPEPQQAPARQTQQVPQQAPAAQQDTAAQPQATGPAATVPVAQRVGLLLQADNPQGFDTQVGTVVWRFDSINRGGALSRAVRADFDVPEAKLKGFITIEKNNDPTLRASHTVTIRFLPAPDSPIAKITDISLPVMRNETAASVDPLAGVQAKITDNIFIVALTSDPNFAVRNIELIKGRAWFDVPMKLADGRAAKITMEKGTPGERIINEAFEAWSR
ncbi:hypothetical protein PY365_19705 [Roseiarcaceae bacterium H3SJ34-1]|uniref:hypothetical protein n=1 Tax=Terripilifer ovatus TaxID=3032367 RepID=UPI003AB9217B|nr:hypothetical protein [Roseiarcaceae bacterium H3SJ34-1]